MVDRTGGKHSGRIYLGVLWGYPVYRVGVFRSDDDGRTWSGPVEGANGGGEIGINVSPLVVLGDGELFVPYIDFEFDPSKRSIGIDQTSNIWFLLSADGGRSFSPPCRLATVRNAARPPVRFQGFPMFAAAGEESRSPGRIFAAWNVVTAEGPVIATAWSADTGKTWSVPLRLPSAASGKQWQPVSAWASFPADQEQKGAKAPTLYQRLGGYDKLAAIFDDVAPRMAGDPAFARFFTGHATDSEIRQRQRLLELLCQDSGGPCVYTGRSLKTAHAGLGVTEADWAAFLKHLTAALDHLAIGEKEKNETVALVTRYKGEIVEKP